jgi:hypothetical protein
MTAEQGREGRLIVAGEEFPQEFAVRPEFRTTGTQNAEKGFYPGVIYPCRHRTPASMERRSAIHVTVAAEHLT